MKYINRKQRIDINLDKHTYDYLKSKKINVSKMVRQLLKVALFTDSTSYTNYTNDTNSLPLVRTRSGVQFPPGAFQILRGHSLQFQS